MNIYIQTQILNMTMAAQSFVQTCRLGALKDDGRIDPDEERILKKINTATENYIKELNKIKGKKGVPAQERSSTAADRCGGSRPAAGKRESERELRS